MSRPRVRSRFSGSRSIPEKGGGDTMGSKLLDVKQLRWRFPVADFADKDLKPAEKDRHGRPGALGQERALTALELGLGIRERGFNIFVVGASGTGRTSTVRELLEARA